MIAAGITANWWIVRVRIARRLGHNVDESAVLCVRCMKAIPLKA